MPSAPVSGFDAEFRLRPLISAAFPVLVEDGSALQPGDPNGSADLTERSLCFVLREVCALY